MNNKLICPFCNSELVKDTPFAWNCPNEECVETDMMWGTANMWQELIRTRKALEIAKDAIDVISLKYHKTTPSIILIKYAEHAKAEITALEQKKHFADASKTIV